MFVLLIIGLFREAFYDCFPCVDNYFLTYCGGVQSFLMSRPILPTNSRGTLYLQQAVVALECILTVFIRLVTADLIINY